MNQPVASVDQIPSTGRNATRLDSFASSSSGGEMAENSKIEWTDHTFNPWMGCTKVSPACKNCYAERDFDHRYGKVEWGPAGTRVVTSDANWRKPLKWDREAAAAGIRKRVFCASLADVFEDWQGPIHNHQGMPLIDGINFDERDSDDPMASPATMNDVRRKLFQLIDATPNLDWLLLTKRTENILKMWPTVGSRAGVWGGDGTLLNPSGHHRPNVWIGTSVENQEYAEKRIPELLKCRDLSPVLFLSCEPLVGPVNIGSIRVDPNIDWVITGGESGPGARPMHPDWFRSLRDQCEAAGVPFHFKQWGEWVSVSEQAGDGPHHSFDDGATVRRVGKKAAGRLLDGVEHDGLPSPLMSI